MVRKFEMGDGDASHTILFLQVTDAVSRTYCDYKDTDAAMFGMCEMFEETYKRKTGITDVTYEIEDVIQYFKSFTEVVMLVFDEEMGTYRPYDMEWIATQLEEYGKSSDVDATPAASQNGVEAGVAFEEDWEQ